MGRNARIRQQAKQQRMMVATPIPLSETDYLRLMNLAKDVQIEINRCQQTIAQAQAQVQQKEHARNTFLADLAQRYPALRLRGLHPEGVDYEGDDASFTLRPRSITE